MDVENRLQGRISPLAARCLAWAIEHGPESFYKMADAFGVPHAERGELEQAAREADVLCMVANHCKVKRPVLADRVQELEKENARLKGWAVEGFELLRSEAEGENEEREGYAVHALGQIEGTSGTRGAAKSATIEADGIHLAVMLDELAKDPLFVIDEDTRAAVDRLLKPLAGTRCRQESPETRALTGEVKTVEKSAEPLPMKPCSRCDTLHTGQSGYCGPCAEKEWGEPDMAQFLRDADRPEVEPVDDRTRVFTDKQLADMEAFLITLCATALPPAPPAVDLPTFAGGAKSVPFETVRWAPDPLRPAVARGDADLAAPPPAAKSEPDEQQMFVAGTHFDLIRAIDAGAGHNRQTTPTVGACINAGLLVLGEFDLAELTPIGHRALTILKASGRTR